MTPSTSPRRRSLAVASALAGIALTAAPASAPAAEKSIWGPATLAANQSAFPVYASLGVDNFQTQLTWDTVAPTRPVDPTNPNDPAYKWPVALDTTRQQARANGISVALLVVGTPKWANGGRDRTWAPTVPEDYAAFVAAASRRYPDVKRWMIWGEPNMAIRFKPQQADTGVSARAYAPILDAAYGALKSVSASNIVIGGMTWTGGDVQPARFIQDLKLADGRAPRMDWFGHNPYPYRQPNLKTGPEGNFRDISDLDTFGAEIDRALGRKNVPLWLSEYMIQSDRGSQAFATFVSQPVQANYIRSGFKIADSLGSRVRSMAWFSFADQAPAPKSANWGLVTHDFQPKPALAAFRDAPSVRHTPAVGLPKTVRRAFLRRRGLGVRVAPRTGGRYSVQLRKGGKLVKTVRRTFSRRTVVRVRSGARAGRYTIRVLSPRGTTIERSLRVR